MTQKHFTITLHNQNLLFQLNKTQIPCERKLFDDVLLILNDIPQQQPLLSYSIAKNRYPVLYQLCVKVQRCKLWNMF